VDVTVYPEEGNFRDVAKGLLEAADHPGQVRMVSHPKAGFIVPEEVFERFEAGRTDSKPESSEPQDPPKRRPGRPRKVTPSEEE
jgi:hypothetical protein